MSLSLAVVLLGNPTRGFADDGFASAVTFGVPAAPGKMPELLTDKVTQPKSSELLQIAGVDYCYAGSMVDPTSGETIDLFVFCGDDAIAGNLDLA
jgi:hypothetical protein